MSWFPAIEILSSGPMSGGGTGNVEIWEDGTVLSTVQDVRTWLFCSPRTVGQDSRRHRRRSALPGQAMTTSIKLYCPRLGSALRTHWVAAELGISYDSVPVDFSKAEHKSDAFLAINPMGQVPALVDGEFKLAESMAIC